MLVKIVVTFNKFKTLIATTYTNLPTSGVDSSCSTKDLLFVVPSVTDLWRVCDSDFGSSCACSFPDAGPGATSVSLFLFLAAKFENKSVN